MVASGQGHPLGCPIPQGACGYTCLDSAMFTVERVQQIRDSYARLGIAPTIDKSAIIKAFRLAAQRIHPDKFQTPAEKELAHSEFIGIVKARDIALEAITQPEFLEYLSGGREPAASTRTARPTMEDKHSAHEREWEVFARDQDAYFNMMTTTSATLTAVMLSFGLGVVVSLLLGGWILCILVIGGVLALMLTALFSASVSIPIIGWIRLFFVLSLCSSSIKWVGKQLDHSIDASAGRMLKQVVRTGRPTQSFWLAFFIAVAILLPPGILLCTSEQEFWGVVLLILLSIIGIAIAMVYAHIGSELSRLDSAFADIRGSRGYALICRR